MVPTGAEQSRREVVGRGAELRRNQPEGGWCRNGGAEAFERAEPARCDEGTWCDGTIRGGRKWGEGFSIVKADRAGRTRYTDQYKAEVCHSHLTSLFCFFLTSSPFSAPAPAISAWSSLRKAG